MIRCHVGLGANLGDPVAALHAALDSLDGQPMLHGLHVSSFWRTAPVDAIGPDFVNAVAGFDTPLAPLDLLDLLQALENAQGRTRPWRNAPRTLDLDLLLYGEDILDLPRLQVPHPRMTQRAFVLEPLAELCPDARIPGTNASLADLRARCADQSVQRLTQVPRRKASALT